MLGAVVGFVLAASAVAIAAWLVSGGAEGKVKGGSLVAPTSVTVLDTELVGTLLPGGTGAVTLKLNNTNTVPVFVTGWDNAPVSSASPSCPASNLTVIPKTGLSVGPVPAGQTTLVQLPGAVQLSADAPTACQNAVFSVTWSAGAEEIHYST